MTLYDVDHPVRSKLQDMGNEITSKVKPEAVVVFSAHWQTSSHNKIEVNTKENASLIYDFYNFPDYYYKEQYPNFGSEKVALQVMNALKSNGIDSIAADRGLDHGVWVCFKIAFDPTKNPLNVPIVQVSLFNSEDPTQHYNIGRAVASLRSQNIAIIVSGMAVHNTRDFRSLRGQEGSLKPLPYTVSFDEALKNAVTSNPTQREREMRLLLQRSDARQAHPTFEHLLPIHIGAGAAEDDIWERLWTLQEGPLSWAQYRFGEVQSA